MGRRSRRRTREALVSEVAEDVSSWLQDTELRVRINHRRKISTALVELVRPFLHEVTTLDEFRALVTVGILAWNASVVEDEHGELNRLLREHRADDELADVVMTLLDRKQRLFARDRRLVVSWKATRRSDSTFHLSAAAAHTA